MKLQAAFFTLFALMALILPGTFAAKWNRKLKVWNVGTISSVPGFPGLAPADIGKCGGIPDGGYVCGSFGPGKKVAMRAIYSCRKGLLVQREICSESDVNNRCVKNERRKGKKFYPFVSGDKIVCVNKSDL